MKKLKKLTALIILLTVLCLVLNSCSTLLSRFAQDPTEPPTETPSESSDPTGGNEKPSKGVLDGFTVFPEGEYLEERFRTSDPLPGYDYVPTFHGNWVGGTPTSCSNESTYYYIAESADGGSKMLYYMDKVTGTSAPLCGKPECLHTDSTCNGYLGNSHCYTLSLYDGRIWWINLGLGAEVHSCALDGTDHRLDFKISQDLVGTGGVPDIYFHRGTMYWVETDNKIINGELTMLEDIIAFPLDGSDPYYVYQAHPALDGGFPFVFFFQDKMLLFFDTTELIYGEDNIGITDWRGGTEIYLYDLNTRQVETLFAGETDFFMGGRRPDLREDGIYFVGACAIEDGSWVPASCFLPWGGDTFEPLEEQRWFAYCFDGRFIYLHLSDDELTVTERTIDGTLILDRSFLVRYTGNPYDLGIQGWDEDYYYIRLPSVDVAVATDAHALYYLAGTEKES